MDQTYSYRPNSGERGRIIIVDDDPAILSTLKNILGFMGFEIKTFNQALSALENIKEHHDDFDVILTDINMPGMNGIDFIKNVKTLVPDAVIVCLTGYPSAEHAIGALRAGAFDFLEKPFINEHLALNLDRAVEMHKTKRELEEYKQNLERMLEERTAEVKSTLSKLKKSYMTTMEVITMLLEAREPNTARHSMRVSERTVLMAKKMGISEPLRIEQIARGSLLHDIGKIGVPDAILLKPGKLTDDEMKIMRNHVEIGFNIVNAIPDMEKAAEIVHSHHERFDGKGYPRGLSGNQIDIGARIFTLIDTYDAIRFERCYHKGESIDSAIAEIKKSSGSQLDPEVVKIFLENIDELEKIL